MKKPGGRCVSRWRARACTSVFARWSGEVCAEGGAAYVEGVCEGFLLSVIHVFGPRPCSYGNVSI